MPLEPILKASLAVHSNPGVYALVLGSGISRAAGIPTGSEVVLTGLPFVAVTEPRAYGDLIRMLS